MRTCSRAVAYHAVVAPAACFCLSVALAGLPPTAMAQARAAGAPSLAQLTDWERRDMGVAPPPGLRNGALHGPTPNRIPGGQVITTQGLVALLQRPDTPAHLFHILDWGETLPFAVTAPWASQPGTFDDRTQRQLGSLLEQVAGGNAQAPLIFYCASAECWMSYNASVRAIHLGYRNVLWYRGGLEGWTLAGLRTFRPKPGTPGPDAGVARVRLPGGGGTRPPGALPPDAFGPDPGPRR